MVKLEVNGFKIQDLPLQPKHENPFLHDFYHMGQSLGKNLVVMYSKHKDEKQPYIILVNTDTGQRIKIHIEE